MYKNRFEFTSAACCFNPARKKSEVRVFDTSLVADYAVNSFGYLRSDFSELNERNDALGMARLLSRMQELSEDDSGKGKSFEDLLKMLRPRTCQLPGELDRFEQYCINEALDFYNKLKSNDVAKLAHGDGIEVSDSVAPVAPTNPV